MGARSQLAARPRRGVLASARRDRARLRGSGSLRDAVRRVAGPGRDRARGRARRGRAGRAVGDVYKIDAGYESMLLDEGADALVYRVDGTARRCRSVARRRSPACTAAPPTGGSWRSTSRRRLGPAVAAPGAIVARPMDPRESLHAIFGFEEFRPGQAEAVAAALADRDALVVMPTGSGKSLCYQLPALMRDDLTLVVSPLVSLMQDQVQALERVAPGPGRARQRAARRGARTPRRSTRAVAGEVPAAVRGAGAVRVAPVRRRGSRGRGSGCSSSTRRTASRSGATTSAPTTSRSPTPPARVGARATIALTATATPAVADDIARRLALRDPVRVTTGFDRPNLSFAVVPCDDRGRQAAAPRRGAGRARRAAGDRLRGHARQRASCSPAAWPRALGEEVRRLPRRARPRARAPRPRSGSWPARRAVIVATNAFGMGIDKADVRTVCHATVPGSLEAYYQEAGRAGRDGAPARCLLFAEQRDKGLHVFFIQRAARRASVRAGRERLRWAGRRRYDVAVSWPPAPGDGDEDDRPGVIGHLPAPGCARRRAADRAPAASVGEWIGQRSRVPASPEAERVRWASTARLGLRRGRPCRRRRCWRTSATVPARRRRVLRRLRAARLAPRSARSSARRRRRRRRSTRAIVGDRAPPRRRSAARARSRSCAAGARR